MAVAAEFGSGQVLWSMLWFFLFFIWIWLLFTVFGDIVRAKSLSGWGKALWTVGIIFLPYLGVFLYLIVNGSDMSRRDEEAARASEEAVQAYIRDAAGTQSAADELSKLAALHESGALSDAEYAQAKNRAVNG